MKYEYKMNKKEMREVTKKNTLSFIFIYFPAFIACIFICFYTECSAKILSKEDLFQKIVHGVPSNKISFEISKFKSGTQKDEILAELGTPSLVNHDLNSWYYINIEKTYDMLKINTKYTSTVVKFIFSQETDNLIEVQKSYVKKSKIPKISKRNTEFKIPIFDETLMAQLKFVRVSNI